MTLYLSATDAARRLGVSRQTLYAYVSRGLLRAHETDDPRQRRYETGVVERLAAERRRGRRPKEVAKAALDWGLPVMESAITLIQDGRLYYRGHDALTLARDAAVEDVAALLWALPVEAAFGPSPPRHPNVMTSLLRHYAGTPREEALLPLFAAATSDDATAFWQQDRVRLAHGCGDLVRVMMSLVVNTPPAAAPMRQWIGEAWKLDDAGTDLVRMAIILCADHELNASSFTARCVASTGASLRAVILGGLAALSGPRHGGMTARIEAFWDALDADDPAIQLRRRLAAGDELPGFGHPLYPDGDARAEALLARILPRFPQARAFATAAEELTGRKPNIDFALVALRRFLNLPESSAFGLFALGRSIGWIAHALEQRQTGQLIRPRAVYVGPAP
ncbi:MAG: helix-turn-helix domain-containing protein [Acetobacteraceae bacterium]|nr:helix-turn-helix domain-containing protein [Acetobacteraceae bacterium]